MKRLVSILLMICLVVSLAACGGSGSGSQASGGEMPDVFWMHINEAQKYMRADIGKSPQEYLIQCRMDRSRQLLLETDLSIQEIAVSVGYDDQLTFSRIFKKNYGESPARFRTRPF